MLENSSEGNETTEETGGSFVNIDIDNLVSDALLAGLALLALVICLGIIFLLLKYAYRKLP
jgi:hypothetical protein